MECEGRRRALDGRSSRRVSEAVEAAPSPGSERVACVRVGFPGTREASSSGSVTLKLTDVSDAQQSGVETCWSPVSWGSIDEIFVNLTSPLRIQAFKSMLPDPRLTHRAKREQRAGSRTTGTRHHESDGSDPHQQGDDDPTGHGYKPTRPVASSARTLNPRETRYGPWGALPN